MPGPRPSSHGKSRGGRPRQGTHHRPPGRHGHHNPRPYHHGHFPRMRYPPRRPFFGYIPERCPHCGNLMYPVRYLPGGGLIVKCSFIYCQFTMTLY